MPEVLTPGPVTVHASTSVALQETTELSPERMRVGFAEIESSGLRTVAVQYVSYEPPAPEHLMP